MIRKIGAAAAVALLLAGCGAGALKDGKRTIPTNEKTASFDQNQIQLAKVDGIQIYADKEAKDGLFTEMTIKTARKEKKFPWTNVNNESFYPTMTMSDVNNDSINEIVVLLTKDHGSGIHIEEAHVLTKDLKELPIEDPLQAVQSRVKSEIIKSGGKVTVRAEVDHERIEKVYNKTDAGDWNEEVGYGSIVEYSVANNTLSAEIAGGVSQAEFAFTAKVDYGPDLKVKKITLVSN